MRESHSILRARPGDRLVIHAHYSGEAEHDGDILKVLGDDGAPPFVFRSGDGDVSRLRPSLDAYVQHPDGDGGAAGDRR